MIIHKSLNIMFRSGPESLQTRRLIFSLSAADLFPASLSCLSFPPDAALGLTAARSFFLSKQFHSRTIFLFRQQAHLSPPKKLHRNLKGVRMDSNGVKISA